MGRPKGAQNEPDNLRLFAIRIEREFQKAHGEDKAAMERLVCRLLSNAKNPMLAATMAAKWVEWKYGKAKETHEHKHDVKVEMSLSDADALIAGYFAIAPSRANQDSAGNTGQAQEQDSKLLPA